jgi:predicted amidohydrolase YtcJ
MRATKLRRCATPPAALLLTAVACAGLGPEAPADHVFRGGRVYTVDAERRVVDAVATRGDRIVYVGDDEGAQAFVGDHTRVHELSGRMLLPGLHDVHIHPLEIVAGDSCDLDSEPRSLDEMVPFLQDCIDRYAVSEGEWLTVSQWSFTQGNEPSERHPTLRAALDAASTRHPILLRGDDGHHAAANSRALERARDEAGREVGLSARTLAGEFAGYRDLVGVEASGEPNGSLTEGAIALLGAPGYLDPRDLPGVLPDVARVLAESGITSVQDAAVDPAFLPAYRSLEENGGMTFRLYAALIEGWYAGEKPALEDVAPLVERFTSLRLAYAKTDYIRADAAKIFVDGVIEGDPLSDPPTLPNAAALEEYRQPLFEIDPDSGRARLVGYVDLDGGACAALRERSERISTLAQMAAFRREHGFHPAQCRRSRGVLEHDVEFVNAYVLALDAADFRVHAHAIGDRAVRVAVDAFAAARDANGARDRRHGIAHAQLVHPDDQRRIGELGLYVAFTHAWSEPDPVYDLSVVPFIDELQTGAPDLYDLEHYYPKNVYPAASIQRLGGIVTAGSDAPVDDRDPRPFFNLEQAVTRENDSMGDGVVLNAAERLSIHDAIAAYTINGARSLGDEDRLGSVEVGKLADLIVIDQDLVALAERGQAERISDTRVLTTMFDGRIVMERAP